MAWLLIVVALCAVVIAVKAHRRTSPAAEWPVRPRDPLSRPEQVLYWRLRDACPGHVVLAQVAIAQLLEVDSVRNRQSIFNRYSRLVADFVVCTPSFGVVAVIELDDRSHTTPGRADADERKSGALGAAGIALLRFHVHNLPTTGELRSLLVMPNASQAEEASHTEPPRRAMA